MKNDYITEITLNKPKISLHVQLSIVTWCLKSIQETCNSVRVTNKFVDANFEESVIPEEGISLPESRVVINRFTNSM